MSWYTALDTAEANAKVFDADFAALGVGTQPNSVIVYRVGGSPSPTIDESYRANLPAETSISYSAARLTAQQVTQINGIVNSHLSDYKASGLRLGSWGLRDTDAEFQIRYDPAGRTPTADDLAPYAQFGEGNVQFVAGGAPVMLDRINDTPPWWGGARIDRKGTTVGQCTTGFSSKSSLTQDDYVSTAWHCYDGSTEFVTGGGEAYGYATIIDGPDDIVFIDVSAQHLGSAAYVYNDAHGGATSRIPVNSQFSPRLNNPLCLSGSFSYLRCNAEVSNGQTWLVVNTYLDEEYSVTGWRVISTDGTWLAADGDSGGPAWVPQSDGSAKAVGTISAGDPPAVSCPSWLAGHKCYSTIFISDYGFISSRDNMTVTTGPGGPG